jgi:hypothetical protein
MHNKKSKRYVLEDGKKYPIWIGFVTAGKSDSFQSCSDPQKACSLIEHLTARDGKRRNYAYRVGYGKNATEVATLEELTEIWDNAEDY